jgi:hypothetical protein
MGYEIRAVDVTAQTDAHFTVINPKLPGLPLIVMNTG